MPKIRNMLVAAKGELLLLTNASCIGAFAKYLRKVEDDLFAAAKYA